MKKVCCRAVGKYLNVTKCAKGTQIVNSSRMVVMDMGKQNSIQSAEIHGNHLLPKVGTTIDENALTRVEIYQSGSAKAFVARVARCADCTLTAYLRNASACART